MSSKKRFYVCIDLSTRCLSAQNVSPEGKAKLLDSLPSDSMLRSQFEKTLDTERAFDISSFVSWQPFDVHARRTRRQPIEGCLLALHGQQIKVRLSLFGVSKR